MIWKTGSFVLCCFRQTGFVSRETILLLMYLRFANCEFGGEMVTSVVPSFNFSEIRIRWEALHSRWSRGSDVKYWLDKGDVPIGRAVLGENNFVEIRFHCPDAPHELDILSLWFALKIFPRIFWILFLGFSWKLFLIFFQDFGRESLKQLSLLVALNNLTEIITGPTEMVSCFSDSCQMLKNLKWTNFSIKMFGSFIFSLYLCSRNNNNSIH